MKITKKIFLICMFLMLSVSFYVFVNAESLIENNQDIKIIFNNGTLPNVIDEQKLFDEVVLTATTNISNNLVLPNLQLKDIEVNSVYTPLDVETFYFGEKEIYSFTGWHIVGTTEYLPAQTVFQPGDMVTSDVLEKYVVNNNGTYELNVEAVWGKCYFIGNPYQNMKYTTVDGIYTLNEELSTNPTAASDDNDGLTPEAPKATIDGLFDYLRNKIYVEKTIDSHNAYLTVVMLVGDLDYYKDSNIPSSQNIYGQKVNNTKNAFISATYKSLQKVEGQVFTYSYKPRGYFNMVYSNIRLDNIKFVKADSAIFAGQSVGAEFQLYHDCTTRKHYFEATSRYNVGVTSGKSAINTFRPSQYDIVCLNGGTFGTFHTTYSTAINRPSHTIEWYVGRKATINSNITCGVTSAYASNTVTVNVNFNLTITGGAVLGSIYGGNSGVNSKGRGERRINIYGDGTTKAGEYNPSVNNIFGGSFQAQLYGDVYIDIKNVKTINNLYGGGDQFTATTYGNIDINIENSLIKGDLFGGGRNANSEKDSNGNGGNVLVNLKNTEIQGNVFGSGMGMSQTIEIADTIYSYYENKTYDGQKWWNIPSFYPEDWNEPLEEYPHYEEDTGYVLIGLYKTITWSSQSTTSLTFKYNYIRAYLSLATVENVEINIDDSIIGTSSNGKGNVYGGGSIAQVLGNTTINITGENTRIYGTVYGGGDGVTVPGTIAINKPIDKDVYEAPTYKVNSVDAKGNPNSVTIEGQFPAYNNAINSLGNFSWSNDKSLLDSDTKGIDFNNKLLYSPNTDGLGAVKGNATVNITDATVFGDVYGGGNKGIVEGDVVVNINGLSNLKNVYGGSNQANIEGFVTLNVNNGTIDNAYGGNNLSGSIDNQISVNIFAGKITNLYGGGNKADAKAPINLIIGDNSKNPAIINLYGGGKEASVEGIDLLINNGDVTTVYGGGDQGDTLGEIEIAILDGTITTIYSGANKADITGNVNLTIDNCNITELFGGNNYSGDIKGNVFITINNGIIDTLYGGGNKADDNYASTITIVNALINVLYGGGKNAAIDSSNITLNGGTINADIYGGGFAGDVVSTNISINNGLVNNNVYGGGYEGNITSSNICIQKGIIKNNVYGGGFAGTADKTNVQINEETDVYNSISIGGSVFGGGEGITATVYSDTNVYVNLNIDLEVEEENISTEEITSGQTEPKVTILGSYSQILGSVYGGGDLGQVGNGTIDKNSNTATITKSGISNVLVVNGYIGGSVFGGGSGVPTSGVIYELRMGTIFGSAKTMVYGGYIIGNVYGGGTQSRLYQGDSEFATSVNIIEYGLPIIIGGSVFGGGDRGNSATTNASVPTVVGDVEVNIGSGFDGISLFNSTSSKIYFLKGGVYGDGNLCLVNGYRTINMKNFTTGDNTNLKTFYSLQRADVVNLENSDFVLLGAIDLVEEGDITVYSINRIKEINFQKGSTIKLDQIVKYLSSITSDYEFENGDGTPDRDFIDRGNNGSNNFNTELTNPQPLTDAEKLKYYNDTRLLKNTICVANGLYLELMNTDNTYGTKKGLTTLQLLKAVPGEGGGFVYASLDEHLGTFICETKFAGDDKYMPIVDDVSGVVTTGEFTYYVWYIQGSLINYNMGITGYIGSDQKKYETSGIAPKHSNSLAYVLKEFSVNQQLEEVLTKKDANGDTVYTLVSEDRTLKKQEIALEIVIGNVSLGFLSKQEIGESYQWGIETDNGFMNGYEEDISIYAQNILKEDLIIDNNNNSIKLILHKSTEVNAEIRNMQVDFEIDLFEISTNANGDKVATPYNDGTSQIVVECAFEIVRLVPEQKVYSGIGNLFAGVSTSEIIKITSGSSFTMEYQTRYIPNAFPNSGDKTLKWSLSVANYSYYMDELGNYLTVDANNDCVAISSTLAFDKNKNGTEDALENPKGKAFVIYNSSTGLFEYQHGEKLITMKFMGSISGSMIPKGTKITLIDLSDINQIGYYYAIVNSEIYTEIDLDDFYIMGTNTRLGDIENTSPLYPTYKKMYDSGASSRVTERFIIIFDFEQANIANFEGLVTLAHKYSSSTESVDIMDYVNSKMGSSIDDISYIRSMPKSVSYETIDTNINDGIDSLSISFDKNNYVEDEEVKLLIDVKQDELYKNTQFESGELGLKLEFDSIKLPDGIEFEFNNVYLPKLGNQYVIVPILKYGEHTVLIKNILGFNPQSAEELKVKATLCYLPDDQFYNESVIVSDSVSTQTDVCYIGIKENKSFNVQINNRISTVDGIIEVNVQTKNVSANQVEVFVENTNYRVYIDLIGETEKIGEYKLYLERVNLKPGTYTIVFTVDELKEKINIIIE